MSDLHLSAQTTRKYELPLNHLDYSYIEKCSNVKELEKILRVLRSGDEGHYPDLEKFTENRLQTLCPKSRVLRKDNPISRPSDIGGGDWKEIEQDLKNWTNDMHNKDSVKTNKVVKAQDDFYEGDENLPPVRSSNVLEGNKRKEAKSDKSNKKRVMPRDYKEWDKVDVDEELRKVDDSEEKTHTPKRSSVEGVTNQIDGTGLSEEDKERKANREKDKGNEAYRSGDFEESVLYYSRSISLLPTTASYNNRALAYLKLEKWDKAIKDCNTVLNLEKENIKALLRRGTAYKSKNQLAKGKADFEKVLALEPNNKKAESLLQDVDNELQKEAKSRREKGRRMVIEEVEESDDDDGAEEIEVEKPMVNGYGNHGKENGIKEPSDTEDIKSEEMLNASETKDSSQQMKSNNVNIQSRVKKQLETDIQPSLKDKVKSSSHTTDQDTKDMCSQNVSHSNTTSSLPVTEDKTSAFPKGDQTEQPAAAISSDQTSSVSSLSSQSSLSETAEDQTSTLVSQAKANESALSSSLSHSSVAAENKSSLSTPYADSSETSQSFNRPILVQLPLPVIISKQKEEGNNLFRSGQYNSAIQSYSKAISQLEKDPSQVVNISLMLSNRAACHLKTGNHSEAVSDCERSLKLVPHGLKPLLRRAAAYETLEKYGKAYVDYKHALSIDNSVEQAFQGANRCQRILQEVHGQREWRDKIPSLNLVKPWEIPLIVDQAKQSPSPVSSAIPASSASSVSSSSSSSSSSASVPVPTVKSESLKSIQTPSVPIRKDSECNKTEESFQPSKEQKFEQLKASGNSHVQKGDYLEAETCYTSCIALCPEQVACYTNRALCYIKLNKATEAEADCDKALSIQPENPKALYRRALARKMLQRYKLSMQDLVQLLKLEPKNKAASSEMEIVKQFYKEELEQLKQKKQEPEGKVRKRMKIEEVDDEDDEEKPGRAKAQVKSQSKARSGKSNQPPSIIKSKGSNQSTTEKKKSGKDAASSDQGLPAAPLSAPRLMKTTPYEFCQAWNSLKPTQGIQPYAEILRQISPPDLPSVISNKLDGQMLQIIVRCVSEEMVLKGEVDKGYQILDNLCKVPRFSTVSMFLSGKEKKEVSSVLDILGKTVSSAYSKADILRLKKEYSVK